MEKEIEEAGEDKNMKVVSIKDMHFLSRWIAGIN